jgi:molybdopterin-guanine dinucleotide biosynthesis protein A
VIGGLILAGGRSTRFGGEKAVAPYLGRPLIAHVRDVLAPCAAVAVSARDDSGAAAWAAVQGLDVLHDPPGAPDGPLSGLREGLRWARRRGAPLLATAPCDMPRLPEDLVPRLEAALRAHPGGGAVAETEDGLQPLVALWQVAPALQALEGQMQGGAHPPVRDLLAAVDGVRLRFAPAWLFANVNAPQDLG